MGAAIGGYHEKDHFGYSGRGVDAIEADVPDIREDFGLAGPGGLRLPVDGAAGTTNLDLPPDFRDEGDGVEVGAGGAFASLFGDGISNGYGDGFGFAAMPVAPADWASAPDGVEELSRLGLTATGAGTPLTGAHALDVVSGPDGIEWGDPALVSEIHAGQLAAFDGVEAIDDLAADAPESALVGPTVLFQAADYGVDEDGLELADDERGLGVVFAGQTSDPLDGAEPDAELELGPLGDLDGAPGLAVPAYLAGDGFVQADDGGPAELAWLGLLPDDSHWADGVEPDAAAAPTW